MLVEHKDGNVLPSTFPVITAAQQLAQNVTALVAGGKSVDKVIKQTSKIAKLKKARIDGRGTVCQTTISGVCCQT